MRPDILYPIFRNLTSIQGVGDKNYKLVEKFMGEKVVNFLWHMPSNIIDRTYSPNLLNAKPNRIATLKIKVIEHIAPKTKKMPYKVICTDGVEQITLSFFKIFGNSIARLLPNGETRVISGKIELFNNGWQMSHPDYIVPENQLENIMIFETVYPLTAGISNKVLNKWIKTVLSRTPKFEEWLDEDFVKKEGFPSFNQALIKAHNPQSQSDLLPSNINHKRIAYDEILANQLALALIRQKVKKQKGRVIIGNGSLREQVIKSLPFKLTNAQETVLQEIYQDQASNYRMLRLLQGDVGSGKTITALLVMLNAIETNAQACIMAPTEILAKQHLESITPIAEEIGINIELLTGRTKGKKRTQILENLKDGKIDIIIGTHALFQEEVIFNDLACVIIDEQHRFGVHQRLALSNKGNNADVLVMTATPIPRTLMLTAYGDMEYSIINQVPEGRKPTDTRVMPISKMADVIAALDRKIKTGTRAYWVCPLVEESEKLDLAAAEERFTTLKQHFGDIVGLVHGKMKEKEKDSVMDRFKKGEITILVATTVIEVGVNVPEATIMIIEHAERFGLAQLHQLRGRVKRGFEASTCLLLYGYPLSQTSHSRLNTMKETEDGFIIAEKDLELRGSGEVLGTRQSGFLEYKLADLEVHKDLLLKAATDAKQILETDPELSSKRGQNLKILLYLFERDEVVNTYNA